MEHFSWLHGAKRDKYVCVLGAVYRSYSHVLGLRCLLSAAIPLASNEAGQTEIID